MRLCIIADDLTGALDAAAPFAGRGSVTTVALRPAAIADALRRQPDVLAVSTQSRDGSAPSARDAVLEVLSQLPPGFRLFKKIDSRLKGHISAEILALAPARLLVCPAIPEFGRIVQGGALCGHGVETPIAIAPILGGLAARAFVPDTMSGQDLLNALDAAAANSLPVGARGLAEALAIRSSGQALARPAALRPGPALIVIGSRDPVTTDQAELLHNFDWRAAPSGRLADGAPGRDVTVVQATVGTHSCPPAAVAEALACSVHPALTARARTLLLTGGATAEAVLNRMGLSVLDLEGEVLPGIPLATWQDQCIVLKSGGFGAADTLQKLIAMIPAPAQSAGA